MFTFGLVLAVALAGIGLGGLLYALVGRDRPRVARRASPRAACSKPRRSPRPSRSAIAWRCWRSPCCRSARAGFAAAIAGWTLVTAIVVLPPAIVAGYQFPLLIALFGRGREHLGATSAWRTRRTPPARSSVRSPAASGCCRGSPRPAPGGWSRSCSSCSASRRRSSTSNAKHRETPQRHRVARSCAWRRVATSSRCGVTLLLLAAAGPTAIWRHSGIGAGRAPRDVFASPNQLRAWSNAERRAIVWEGDGVESSVALAAEPNGYAFVVNGKSDGSARGDAGTQVMLGLLGAIGHPQPRRALVIGLGTGSTAGWLGAIPSMERVDVVELEPLVLDVARACEPVNHDVMTNPKVHVTIGDARETLLTSRDRYDVIASEPSNPFRAGIASLFTLRSTTAPRARG